MTDNIKFQVIDEDSTLYDIKETDDVTSNDKFMQTIQVNLEEKIQEFIKEKNPMLYILTPCFNGMCYINYLHCLIETISFFRRLNFPLKVEFCKNDSLVSRARNNLIARAMTNTSATHFLFIDNDIAWDPLDIIKLLLADKSLIGGIYPLKNYNWSKLVKDDGNPYNSNIIQSWITKKNNSILKDILSDEAMIQNNLLNYNINYLGNSIKIENNITKVKHLATGFMMIQRSTLEKMMKAFPSTKYVDDIHFLKKEENNMAYALFDCGVEEGHYFSEDWLFCDRWAKMGGEIYVDISINLTHTGIEDYRGSYLSSII
uniref:Uncharacterized protein n=1 Tax=viral metagenome TaxID=1070528 RepID=A0A6C0I1B7_9ZZZZ